MSSIRVSVCVFYPMGGREPVDARPLPPRRVGRIMTAGARAGSGGDMLERGLCGLVLSRGNGSQVGEQAISEPSRVTEAPCQCIISQACFAVVEVRLHVV